MRLLLDQGLPRSAAKFLREAGIDTLHVGEIGYTAADDVTILQMARDDGRAVVTLDADFHALLALSQATFPSVIRIRIEGLRGGHAADLIQTVSGGPTGLDRKPGALSGTLLGSCYAALC